MSHPAPPALLEALLAAARGLDGAAGEPQVLSDRADGPVVRCGAQVLKAHAEGTDPRALRARLALISAPGLAELFLQPLSLGPDTLAGRLVTRWPLGRPVDPEAPERAPFAEAGRLLARLHGGADPAALPSAPPAGAPLRVRQAMARLALEAPQRPERAPIEAAYGALPAGWAEPGPQRPTALLHGDFHLGQLVSFAGGWRMIDIDDLGHGDPAWDLARPASWFAVGLISAQEWSALLAGYLDAGGSAIDPREPWASLDVPARAVTIQSAARALAKAERQARALDEVELGWLDACARMAR